MKLKTNINLNKLNSKRKLENISLSKLKKGDYLRLYFLAHNQKRRGGTHFRINKQTVILLKKNNRTFSLSLVVTSLYKYEKVKFRYIVSSPHMVKILFLKKALTLKSLR
tara:strand:+ start:460 stop:786 length:327 start_codon:yes stop_codon:yes gene_type:complete